MSNMLAAGSEIGNYIAAWKGLLMAAAFFGWLPLVNWVYTDSQAVRTHKETWTAAIATIGAAALLLWMMIPVFFIGFLLYLLSVGAATVAYIIHRNARVSDFERILTAEHIRGLFIDENKKLQKLSLGLSFVTSNKNEVPLPLPKTREAEGFIITCEILDDAIWRRADQVIFIPQKDEYTVVYEIDGVPMKQPPRTKEEMEAFIYYVKQLGGLDVEERRKPQQGRFKVIKDKELKTEWQVNTSGSTAGEHLRLERISDYVTRKLEDLGFNDNQIESIRSLRDLQGGGLIIISGPPKSGKTTTLYTLLNNHDPFLNNIVTLEKKIAAELPNITQNVFTLSDTGTTTYGRRLQTLLRRGPDIIGVEECEEPEAVKLATAAALDGKIVYVTMKAMNAGECVDIWNKRLGDKGKSADALTAVINQRLVRKLCPKCRIPYQPNQSLFKKFNIDPMSGGMFYRPGDCVYDKRGKPIICDMCQGTGFYGRTGLFESIRITDELRESIKKANNTKELIAAFRKAGMLYLQEQAIQKVTQGVTSINEVIRNFTTET
ncbi:MAG: Flp pilus assembly complex ATPase component TadA [Planctomycetes bacterium]|nr:Flp pilus assembly complex ATPase component TadA [Planctomycetota bacterium]